MNSDSMITLNCGYELGPVNDTMPLMYAVFLLHQRPVRRSSRGSGTPHPTIGAHLVFVRRDLWSMANAASTTAVATIESVADLREFVERTAPTLTQMAIANETLRYATGAERGAGERNDILNRTLIARTTGHLWGPGPAEVNPPVWEPPAGLTQERIKALVEPPLVPPAQVHPVPAASQHAGQGGGRHGEGA